MIKKLLIILVLILLLVNGVLIIVYSGVDFDLLLGKKLKLTEETKKYCEQDSDCGIQFTCCCLEALNKKYIIDVECKKDVLCVPCPWSTDSTLVKCINNQCKLVYEGTYCEKDEDCIKVDSGCCGCGAGGSAITINKNFKTEYEENLKNKCKSTGCADEMSVDINCFAKQICLNKQCEFDLKDHSVCEESYDKDWCYWQFAIVHDDFSLCEKISENDSEVIPSISTCKKRIQK